MRLDDAAEMWKDVANQPRWVRIACRDYIATESASWLTSGEDVRLLALVLGLGDDMYRAELVWRELGVGADFVADLMRRHYEEWEAL